MAKQRYINTHFWDDGYIVTLDPIEKLLFIYFLTNPLTEISGAYEIPVRRVAFDTGIDRDMVTKILARFEEEDKMIYREGWLFICEFIKHQSDSEKINAGIQKLLSDCPNWIKDRVSIQYGYRIDMLSHLNSNSNRDSNSNRNTNQNSKTTKQAVFISQTLSALQTKLKLKKLPGETEWIKQIEWAFLNDFTIEQFLECFDLLNQQEWRTGAVSGKQVTANLPNLAKLRIEAKQNGNKNGRKPDVGKFDPAAPEAETKTEYCPKCETDFCFGHPLEVV